MPLNCLDCYSSTYEHSQVTSIVHGCLPLLFSLFLAHGDGYLHLLAYECLCPLFWSIFASFTLTMFFLWQFLQESFSRILLILSLSALKFLARQQVLWVILHLFHPTPSSFLHILGKSYIILGCRYRHSSKDEICLRFLQVRIFL